MKEEHYEIRYINKTSKDTNKYSLFDIDDKVLLVNEVFGQEKIVLLGNPGIGKTTELKHLFDQLWDKKDDTGLIPFHVDLKFFRSTNKFEDLILYEDWKSLPSIIFILDGLDEIQSLHDFISEFEMFTTRFNDLKIRYVISCRTNIYEKYLIQISGFQTYHLENLTFEKAKSFLLKKHQIDIEDLKIDRKNREFIQSPFFLKLFADYYNKKGKLPTSDAEIWDLYISETINTHKVKYIKKGLLKKPILINHLEKIAFVNELMQRNYISDKCLYNILNIEYNEFTSNPPFLIYNSTQENWSFEHRQIQEFFVAKVLSEKSIEQILDVAKIDQSNAIHPSLFNSISFLINLIDSNNPTYNDLISWLKENQIEILFKADSDRISKELKIDVFQKYFNTECIEKTLWISTKRTSDVSEIANFGDCKVNFDYLMKIIKNHKNFHFRTIYSAIELLNFFDKTSYNQEVFKLFLIDQLTADDFSIEAKSQLLRLIQKHRLVKGDDSFLSTIYLFFKTETNKQLNNSLLSLISEEEDINKYFEFLEHEFLFANEIKDRKVKDEVIRGNSYVVNELILKLSNSGYFLKIIKYFFNSEKRFSFRDNFEADLIEKCIQFIKLDSNFVIKLLSKIKNEYGFYTHDNILKKIIKSSNTEDLALIYLANNMIISEIRFFISEFVNERNVNDLIDVLISKKLSNNEIEFFRNNIANSSNRKVAVIFNNIMEKKGVMFNEPIFPEVDVQLYKENFKKHLQDNFNILFDKKRLLKEIKSLFNENTLKTDDLRKIKRKWYDNYGHANVIDTSISIVENFMYSKNNNSLDYNDIQISIEKDDFVIIKCIKEIIENNKSRNREIIIDEKQKIIIVNWSLNGVSLINFNDIAQSSGRNSFYYLNSYKKIETIFYFQKLFDFNLPQSFLLNSIEFYEFDKSGDLDESFNYLVSLIGNNKLVDKQIIDNINNKELLGLSLSKHIEYALSNNLSETYKTLRKFIINNESVFNDRKKIEDYITLTHDTLVLKELCKDNEYYQFWVSIDIMLKLEINKDFCVAKAIEYLESDNDRFIVDALKVLLQLNNTNAFNYILKSLKKGYIPSFHGMTFSNYSNINELENLIEMYHLIFHNEFDQFEAGYYREFYKTVISNLSLTEENFTKIQVILITIKESLLKKDSDLFYINILIDDSINSFINSRSKPYTFQKAKEKTLSLVS
jgi:hypothetical protein